MQFRLFSFPVTVEPMFFMLAVFLGIRREALVLIALWVAVVFVSVLVHELGHAFVGQRLGLSPAIRLYGMGGLTHWRVQRRLSSGQQIGISFAGPLAGFCFAALIFVAEPLIAQVGNWHVQLVYRDLLWVNIVWGILNLLPILPMDGGHIMQSAMHAYLRRTDYYWPQLISCLVSGFLAGIAVLLHHYWAAFFAGYFCYSGVQALRHLPRTPFRRSRVMPSFHERF